MTGLGATVPGASKVLTLSTAAAVSVSPAAVVDRRPARRTEIVDRLGRIDVGQASQSVPAASFAAMASTRGSVTSPCV